MKLRNINSLNSVLILLVSLLLFSCLGIQEINDVSKLNQSQTAVHAQPSHLRLPLPQPRHFLLTETCLTEKEINDLTRKGIAAKMKGRDDITAMQQAIDCLIKAAASPKGSQAIYFLGLICEENQAYELAAKWYVLAFQHIWFEDAAKAHKSPVYDKIVMLANTWNTELNRIISTHPADLKDVYNKFKSYEALVEFYRGGYMEPYLSEEENKLKADRLRQVIRELILGNPALLLKVVAYQEFKEKGIENLATSEVQEELKSANFSADAFYTLGAWYEGVVNNHPCNYEKAAESYKKSGSPDAYFRLGELYFNGRIGLVNQKPDYQHAIKYFNLSGQKLAFEYIAEIYQKGLIDGTPDYQKASECLKRADTGGTHCLLAQFCMDGRIGRYNPAPDYEQAQEHLKKCIEKDYMNAWAILGGLYLEGKLGKINDQPDYESAITCFKEAVKVSNMDKVDAHIRADVLFNLGIMYRDGQWKNVKVEPDYMTAQRYFMESGTPNALNNLGGLYSLGLIGLIKHPNGKEESNYAQALAYYQQSNIPHAKLSILELYASGHIQTSLADREQKIDAIIHELSGMLVQLPQHERYYFQGAIAYYQGNWEEAVVHWQKALLYGLMPEEAANLIEELSNQILHEKDLQASSAASVLLPTQGSVSKESVTQELISKEPVSEAMTIKEPPIKDAAKAKFTIDKLTKEQKQQRRMERRKLSFANAISVGFGHGKKVVAPHTIKLQFVNEREEKAFKAFQSRDNRIQALLNDIQCGQWEAVGIGKPKVLKRLYKGYKGCLSRRINQEDRLVYKVIEPGKILILNWEGHYK